MTERPNPYHTTGGFRTARGKRLFVAVLLVGAFGCMLGLYAAQRADAWAPTPIHQSTLCDHETNVGEWGFVITQIAEANAPASIRVTWTGGVTADIPLTFYSGSGATGVAHYVTMLHLDLKVIAATVQIDFVWSGNFNLSHGPSCTVITSTTSTTAPSTTSTTEPVTTTAPPRPRLCCRASCAR